MIKLMMQLMRLMAAHYLIFRWRLYNSKVPTGGRYSPMEVPEVGREHRLTSFSFCISVYNCICWGEISALNVVVFQNFRNLDITGELEQLSGIWGLSRVHASAAVANKTSSLPVLEKDTECSEVWTVIMLITGQFIYSSFLLLPC